MNSMEKLALLGGTPVLKKPLPNYQSLGVEERRAAARAMKSGELSGFLGRGGDKFFGGPFVREVEKHFRRYFKVKHAISFNSATTALQAAVAAVGVGPGDQVITSPFTMTATPAAVLFNNAVPVFADINPQTYCIDARSIAARITPQTKAILAVNLFGGTADYDEILELAQTHHLKVIEDNAQSPGAMYKGKLGGTVGDVGVLSFNVHKVIQSGEGGMLLTNNDRYALRAAMIRNHGEMAADDMWTVGEEWHEFLVGSNYRLTEVQAAIMIEQLKKLKTLNAARVALADYLSRALRRFSWLEPVFVLPRSTHVYYLYPMKFFGERIGISRKTFVAAMAAEGFSISEGYQKPLYLLPVYQKKQMYEHSQFPFVSKEYPQHMSYAKGICPVAERMYERELLVTNLCQPPKTKRHIDSFVAALRKIEQHIDALRNYEKRN